MCTQSRKPIVLPTDADRVVEVLRVVRVDRERRQRSQVDLVRLDPVGVGREPVGFCLGVGSAAAGRPHAEVVQQALEHRR